MQIRIVKSNVSSVGPSSERNRKEKKSVMTYNLQKCSLINDWTDDLFRPPNSEINVVQHTT